MLDQEEQAVNNGCAHERSGNEICTTQCGNVRVFGPVIGPVIGPVVYPIQPEMKSYLYIMPTITMKRILSNKFHFWQQNKSVKSHLPHKILIINYYPNSDRTTRNVHV